MTTRVFYAYVRSKQKVQDKFGSLEDSDGNIITEGFLMAENLNDYFSSVFTGTILVYYQYQKLRSKGECQTI